MSSGIERATGRSRNEWFGVLDEWGAAGRPYREIAGWLTSEHGMGAWWAQKLIVEYEQARGLRQPGVRPGGSFEAGASKTLHVPLERAYAAFTEPELRSQWLPDESLTERGQRRPGEIVRFDRADGTRIVAQLDVQSEGKCTVAIQHQLLPDVESADAAKTYWRERLTNLKAFLEQR